MVSRRASLTVLGVLALLAAVAVQLDRFTLAPMPVWAGPTAWLLTLGCLSGGAWLLVIARTPPSSADGLDAD